MQAFISYSHKDKKHVEKAIAAIKAEGFDIWYDKGIKAGDDWAEKIGYNLSTSSAMILFMSKNAVGSRNVLREIDYAQEHNIQIFTVLIGKPKLSEDLERKLYVNQAISLFSYKTYNDLAKDLSSVLERHVERKAAVKIKKMPIKKGGIGWFILLGIIVIIAALSLIIKSLYAEVPVVKGMLPDSGKADVESAGFECSVAQDYSSEEEYGYIFKQSEEGKTAKTHPIVITQSLGPNEDLTDVPSLIGLHISDGVKLLVEAGIKKFTVSSVNSNDFAEAFISAQSIPGGLKVSRKNEFSFDVVTGPKGFIFTYNNKTYTMPADQKVVIELQDDGSIAAEPIVIMDVAFAYEEKMAINSAETVNATMHVDVDVHREGSTSYGKFRGRLALDFNIDASAERSIVWLAAKSVAGDENGMINIHAASDSFSFELEEFDEARVSAFVGDITGNRDDFECYPGPSSMAMGNGFTVNEMSSVLGLLKYTNLLSGSLNFSIPTISDGYLNQPYYVIIYEDGRVSISFVGAKGNDKVMTFSGMSKQALEKQW